MKELSIPHRERKVYRFLLPEFGVVRLDRIFSDYSFTGESSVFCTRSKRFKHIEPSLNTSSQREEGF